MSTITVACPHCQGEAEVPRGTRGGVACPHCGGRYRPDSLSNPAAPVPLPAPAPVDKYDGPRTSLTWLILRAALGLLAALSCWRFVAAALNSGAGADIAGAAAAVCLTVALAGLACSTRQFRD